MTQDREQWSGGGNTTQNETLVRKANVTGGVTVNPTGFGFPTFASEWTSYTMRM